MEDSLDDFIHKSFLHTIAFRRDFKKLKQILERLNNNNSDILVQHICIYNWIIGLEYVLSIIDLTPQQQSHALTTSCMNGNIDMINIFLQKRQLIIPPSLLETICSTTPPKTYISWYMIVDRLLCDERFNPGIHDSAALCAAVMRHDLMVIDRLLLDPRTDPTAPFRHNLFDKWNNVRKRFMEEPMVFWQYSMPEDRQKWYILRTEAFKELKNELIFVYYKKYIA